MSSLFKDTIISALAGLLVFMAMAAQAQITMTGSVKTEKGTNLVGAYINVEGTNIATLTDLDGNYSITLPEEYADYDVTINYAGYIAETIKAHGGKFDIVLKDKEAQRIQELIVSTQKREQDIVEVPISMTVIDSSKINQNGLYDIDEMSRFVPGFYYSKRNENVMIFGIRGVTSREVESYGQSRISVYMDGVSISRMQTAFMEQYDMQYVQVVKGPQGTLFGRGAELGAVEFIRKKPTNEFSTNISAAYGNYNQRKVVGVLNTPLGSSIANRFAFLYNAHDGFIKNNAGGRLNGRNSIALRNSTSFHLGDRFKFNMVYDYEHNDTPGSSYQCKTQFASNGEVITTNKSPFTTATLSHGGLYIKRNVGGFVGEAVWDISENFDIISTTGVRAHNSDEYFDIDGTSLPVLDGNDMSKGLTVSEELRCNWSLGKKVNGFFGGSYFYERAKHQYFFAGNLRYIYPFTIGKSLKTSLASLPDSIISNIQNIVTAWSEPVKADHPELAGDIAVLVDKFNGLIKERIQEQSGTLFSKWFDVSYWEQTPDFFNDTKETIGNVLMQTMSDMAEEYPLFPQLLAQDSQDLSGIMGELNIGEGLQDLVPLSAVPLNEDHLEDETDYNHTYEASVFADLTWNIYKRLYLTAGLRSTYETLKTGYYSTSKTAPVLGYVIYTNTNGQTVWTEKKYQSLVGRVVLNWMPNPTHNIYLSASRGRRPGMIYFNYNPKDIITLSPETTMSYELGIKGHSKYGHISYSVALYYFDWRNFQTLIVGRVTNETGSLSYKSDDKGKAYGAGTEMSATYTFKPNISLFADFAYTGGTFKDKDMKGNDQATAGNQFGNTPKYTFNMGFNWKHEFTSGKIIYFYPTLYTQSKMYFNDNNTPAYVQGAFILLDANAGIQFARGKVTYDIGVSGRNITNTQYLTFGGNGGEIFGLPTYEVGAPATVNLSLKLFFK